MSSSGSGSPCRCRSEAGPRTPWRRRRGGGCRTPAVYGSAGIIDRLQQEIRAAQRDLATTRAQLAFVQIMARHDAPRPAGALPLLSSTLLLPPPASAAEARYGGGRLLAVRHEQEEEEEEALPMDPDEFLDLGDL
ncbi:hypothetical protein EJB05_48214, partial [Eragrostis curvula]